MKPHSEREHSTWAASSAAANWLCVGRIAMGTLAGEEVESIYAARGTATHQIAERCLRTHCEAISFLDEVIKTKGHEIVVDEDMARAAQFYVDYVRERVKALDGGLVIEKKLTLAKMDPPIDAGGTADAIIVSAAQELVEIDDAKFGTFAVEVGGNKQLKMYALLTLLNLSQATARHIKTIRSVIIQPRAFHADGKIRFEDFHVADLLQWGADLLAAIGRSKEALDKFEMLSGNSVDLDEWVEAHLSPSDEACAFCPALGFCPARRKQTLAVAPQMMKEWFEDPSLETPPKANNMPLPQSVEELAHTLDGLSALEDWINAVRAYGHAQAEAGVEIPGWQLAEKIGNRAWLDETKTVAALKKLKLTEAQIYVRKIVSPAQADKLLGSKLKGKIEALYERPIRGTNLVSCEKTTRPAVAPMASRYFEE